MSTAGRAKVVIPALVAAACAALVAAMLLRTGDRSEPEAPRNAGNPPSGTASTAPESALERGGAPAERAATGMTSPPVVPRPTAAHPGVIRGEVLTEGGAQVPKTWTLHVRPHPWLAGHETAVDRRIELERGETSFEVRDLPLGGYLVEAIAPGLNCLPGNVMLVRGSEDQFVSIQLSPAGFIDGGVLEASGRPAEGLEVTLESAATGERRTEATTAAGTFLFREVRDGEYRILFGRPDSPLLPPQSLVFTAPSMRFPTRTLPPAASLRVEVVDLALRPVAGARISGSASEGGAVDAVADANGAAVVRYLPPGSYRLDARSDQGLQGSAVVDATPEKDASVRIYVRDPKARQN